MSNSQSIQGLVNQRLTIEAFHALCGRLAGVPFVKVVVERATEKVHFINNSAFEFHADYISDQVLGQSVDENLDDFNNEVYHSPGRRYLLATLALHFNKRKKRFFTLETVEVDNMGREMICQLMDCTKEFLDSSIPLFFKPNNHHQEEIVDGLPTVSASVLYQDAEFLPLNEGEAQGRLRIMESGLEPASLEWYDIVVMDRVPDDVPRVSGIINAQHTTPLSHTNVLASGWQIPNAVQIGVIDQIKERGLVDAWVRYTVDAKGDEILLEAIPQPQDLPAKPAWAVNRVRMEEPDSEMEIIRSLNDLRFSDRFRYGTKAANLGEICHLLKETSSRLLGYYQIPRPPRSNLLPHLAEFLKCSEADLNSAASEFLKKWCRVPRGISLPFSLQRLFLESSPRIQQTIGKLKMALQLDAREVDPLCVSLQNMIRKTRMSDELRERIDRKVTEHLIGCSAFVVRSSSNAEDLEDFSAAGVYESFSHVTSADRLFDSIKEVWASLLSSRSTRLRQQVGISLDDAFMGVVIQEQVPSQVGGVLVTSNPTNPQDFRNVYINASTTSVEDVVSGHGLPIQYLFNTVEGGGRTISLGDAKADLSSDQLEMLGRLAFAGRLLQSHFSPDYTFSWPMDIEWLASDDCIHLLQLRPYAR